MVTVARAAAEAAASGMSARVALVVMRPESPGAIFTGALTVPSELPACCGTPAVQVQVMTALLDDSEHDQRCDLGAGLTKAVCAGRSTLKAG